MHKFENPARLDELKPGATLTRVGLTDGDVFCDIGAGTGIFTVEAAKITRNTIYTIDTSDDMLKMIADKIAKQGFNHVVLINPKGFLYPIADNECDVVLMSTVIHEIDDKASLLNEIHRILKPQGKLVIIEFYAKQTPIGPPVDHRISEEMLKEIASQYGFVRVNQSGLGENFYMSEFGKSE
jgi:ubiquinone/menaquinone biosynthesis C-methylase UbiE